MPIVKVFDRLSSEYHYHWLLINNSLYLLGCTGCKKLCQMCQMMFQECIFVSYIWNWYRSMKARVKYAQPLILNHKSHFCHCNFKSFLPLQLWTLMLKDSPRALPAIGTAEWNIYNQIPGKMRTSCIWQPLQSLV